MQQKTFLHSERRLLIKTCSVICLLTSFNFAATSERSESQRGERFASVRFLNRGAIMTLIILVVIGSIGLTLIEKAIIN
jgi:hypothetical protein